MAIVIVNLCNINYSVYSFFIVGFICINCNIICISYNKFNFIVFIF